MSNCLSALPVFILASCIVSDAVPASEHGWNQYSNRDFGLSFQYPACLNMIEESNGLQMSQGLDSIPSFMKLWAFKNRRLSIGFSRVEGSGSSDVMTVSVLDNPDGFKLSDCATAIATARSAEASGETARVDLDSLVVGGARAIHAQSWTGHGDRLLQWANVYILKADGRIFAVSICEPCMKAAISDEFGDYDSVVDEILRSLRYVDY
jgi:hypothetical protein